MPSQAVRYLDEIQVAAMTGLSRRTLQNWRFLKKGPAFFKVGRRVLYAPEDIAEFIERHRVRTTTVRP